MFTHLLTTLAAFATVAASAPTRTPPFPLLKHNTSTTYHGVSINVNAAPLGQPAVYEPAPVEINHLTSLGNNTSASELVLDSTVAIHVNLKQVECRAYKDQEGVVPGSAPFTVNRKAELTAEEVVTVGSVLCYIIEEGE